MFRILTTWLVIAWLLMGCSGGEADHVNVATAAVVYGNDDRQEVFQHPSEVMRARALESTLALIPSDRLVPQEGGAYAIAALTLEESTGVCSDERFADQPTAAWCSGVLIDEDLLLTAGHCVRDDDQCRGFSFVYNYLIEEGGALASINADDIYGCTRLVVREKSGDPFETTPDYSVIQLDRPVEGAHSPVPVRAGAMSIDEPVTMIGFGTGLPAKIDSGGTVANPRAAELDFFVANVDAFTGHSGSPVFDVGGNLSGILVAGRGPDYLIPSGQSCYRVNTFLNNEADEAVHYAGLAVDGLCRSGWRSEALCQSNMCQGADCPPAEWTCKADWYGDGAECHCACGAYDPDCDNGSLKIAGCAAFELCGATAKCEGSNATTLVGANCALRPYSAGSDAWVLGALGLGWVVRRRRFSSTRT